MRWHFPKLKNVFAKCAGISQNGKMALQNALTFPKIEKAFAKCVSIVLVVITFFLFRYIVKLHVEINVLVSNKL
jgi:hypothetical protein